MDNELLLKSNRYADAIDSLEQLIKHDEEILPARHLMNYFKEKRAKIQELLPDVNSYTVYEANFLNT